MCGKRLRKARAFGQMPLWLVWAPVIYSIILLVSAFAVELLKIKTFDVAGVLVPAAVLWFGMLGGLVDSLQGMLFYNRSWNDRFNMWHWWSGVIGSIYGLASYLFLLVIAKAAASGGVERNAAIFAIGAFAIGYGQRYFHAMIGEVFKILFHIDLGPADQLKSSSGANDNGASGAAKEPAGSTGPSSG